MRRFFAVIRKDKNPVYYEHQQPLDAKGQPVMFPVTLEFDDDPDFPVHGGIGGRYKLFDVDLYYMATCRSMVKGEDTYEAVRKVGIHERY